MNPTPNQLIAGVRHLLRDSIGPEVQTEQARAHLRKLMAVLREVDWNDSAFALMRENEALMRLLGDLDARVQASAGNGVFRPIGAIDPSPEASLSGHAQAAQRRVALRAALAGFITQCTDAATQATVPLPVLHGLRACIATALADIAAGGPDQASCNPPATAMVSPVT